MARKSIMTPDRMQRIKSMLSTRNPIERDNSQLMGAANKARTKPAKNFLPKRKGY